VVVIIVWCHWQQQPQPPARLTHTAEPAHIDHSVIVIIIATTMTTTRRSHSLPLAAAGS